MENCNLKSGSDSGEYLQKKILYYHVDMSFHILINFNSVLFPFLYRNHPNEYKQKKNPKIRC